MEALRYYGVEPTLVYRRVASEHKTQWSDVFEPERAGGFDDFPNRAFLERVLPELGEVGDVLEYGCGTGPAACYLAERGLRVDAVDLIPEAIALARRFAHERGVRVNFAVQDVCRWPAAVEKRYDLVVDSYCLQNIVLDEDRAAVFRGVHDRLAPTGHYLISTALYDPDRVYDDGFRYDSATGICYRGGLPYRRHLTPAALRAELTEAGFTVLSLTDGDVVCVRSWRPGLQPPARTKRTARSAATASSSGGAMTVKSAPSEPRVKSGPSTESASLTSVQLPDVRAPSCPRRPPTRRRRRYWSA